MIDNDAALLMEEIQRVTARKTAELEEKIISMGENQPTVIRQITQNGEKSVYVEKKYRNNKYKLSRYGAIV